MALDSMQEIFDKIEAGRKPFWKVVLDTDVEDLLTCTVAGVGKYQGIAGTVKAMKAFQIIKENEPQYT